ncbi:Rpn family recombination-promoting nuclease/putative transposase [Aetokthonos hydrillicola Thurmond2011]|uniref:Rpn family recombination-promoting nuclease/putative transposase n=1 Tax=Aetokthonos hydrillicola Thurmond2011 TaxID=2712845 RepID=A0AAP5I661_9CYAN|nr:Rpn family recombination-promoting nuclease/putative transposase [Aetokthonos hydrillicola]MBO3459488.1 Rpn family recombination-promoting nuclease/putative transposase [Aetokthonos hydrillicola CCALA 1050]MBW4583851.1 Rpn family recombination-promoting nuclease/putative transposase [Aetokthonos hydrillicola CCALA 1050]MDR9895454.1 Rpn family recombination-promoting nuclease/putative transposase [Aetokthonos hydrillicola Thurmond2011]
MKTDTLFYELIKELPQIFFELIGKPNTNPNAYKFTATELKQQSFRLDGTFSTIEGFDNEPLYFVELQTYKDQEFYERLFGEIFVYFRQYRPPNSDWYAIVIYDRRSNEILPHPRYQPLIEKYVRRIYLNELSSDNESIGMGIAKLFVETPKKTTGFAQKLVNKAKKELTDETLLQKVLTFIQSVVVYKFPNLSLEEIEAMLNLSDDIEKTGYYQSVLKKTKLKVVPALLEKGLSIQEIAKALELDVEEVREVARGQ